MPRMSDGRLGQLNAFVVGVAAVAVGQLLAQRLAARVEQDKWDREEKRRRLDRGIQATEAIVDALTSLDRDQFSAWRGDVRLVEGPQPRQEELDQAVLAIKRNALFIHDEKARTEFESLAHLIKDYSAVADRTGDNVWLIWGMLRDHGMRTAGAYVREEPPPKDAMVEGYWKALVDFWEDSEDRQPTDVAEARY